MDIRLRLCLADSEMVLQMLRNGQPEAAMLRQKCKREWSPEAKKMVAGILRNMKRHAALTIADLPGVSIPRTSPPNAGCVYLPEENR